MEVILLISSLEISTTRRPARVSCFHRFRIFLPPPYQRLPSELRVWLGKRAEFLEALSSPILQSSPLVTMIVI